MTSHRVFRSLNRPLTLGGAERRLFFAALTAALAVFILFDRLLASLFVWLSLHAGAVCATRSSNPKILHILFRAVSYCRIYDPFKRQPYEVFHR